MKKLITLLIVFLSVVVTVESANTYLIYRSTTGGTWTNTAGITNPVLVDLSTVNGGSAVSLNAWFADRSQALPTMGGGFQFEAGEQVWIISGTYVLTDSIKLAEGVSLYGGFAGSESAITARAKGTEAWEYTNETILDGNETLQGLSGGSATLATVIDGLTITKCKNTTAAGSAAGARLSGASTTMQNCIVKNCITEATSATSSGGVLMTAGASVKDCYIHDNQTAGYGGGVSIIGDGCKITGSKVSKNTSALFGGGINLYSTTSGVKVLNCVIAENTTTGKSGGGLLVFSTAVTNADPISISDCAFTSNAATGATGSAGALYLNTNAANTINVNNCTFTSNTASATKSTTAGGGAMWIASGTHNITNCIFTGNATTTSHGGAVLIGAGTAKATITNSVFTNNTSAAHGAALMLTYSATINNCLIYGNKGGNVAYLGTASGTVGTFNNCTITSNTNAAGTNPAGIYLSTPSAPNGKFTNCLFYNSGAKPIAVDPVPGSETVYPDVTYCGFDQDLSATWTGSGNIFTVTAACFSNAANNDYHLALGSPAIDAGMANYDYTVDLDSFTRDANYDLGAYEYNPDYVPNAVEEIKELKDCYAYGNTVVLSGIENGKLVNIYSVSGVRVYSQKMTADRMTVTLPAGVYIVNAASQNRKVMVR